jgi:hypothetical protein
VSPRAGLAIQQADRPRTLGSAGGSGLTHGPADEKPPSCADTVDVGAALFAEYEIQKTARSIACTGLRDHRRFRAEKPCQIVTNLVFWKFNRRASAICRHYNLLPRKLRRLLVSEPRRNILPSITTEPLFAEQNNGTKKLQSPPLAQPIPSILFTRIFDCPVRNEHNTKVDALLSHKSNIPCCHDTPPTFAGGFDRTTREISNKQRNLSKIP